MNKPETRQVEFFQDRAGDIELATQGVVESQANVLRFEAVAFGALEPLVGTDDSFDTDGQSDVDAPDDDDGTAST